MTDDTSTPVAVLDRRTARRLAIAEQQHRDADAELERRGRAALQELELAEARRVAVQRRLETRRRRVLGRRSARKGRRTARRAGLRAAAPRLAERALFVGPILFPMAVAWIGQIQYARTIMGWPLPGAVVFAAGFELSTVYVARLDWKARGEGDNGLVFRVATWLFAALAATMNYWHAAGPGLRPNGEAVSYGAMSVAGVVLWELLSTYRHRGRLRAAGTLPPRRPRFGLARWIWFPRITHLARLLALRDGHTLTERAWQAALVAADQHGSVRAAIAILRGRQRIAAASSASGQLPAETFDETTRSSRGETGVETVGETSEQIAVATRVETSSATDAETADEMDAETTLHGEVETRVERARPAGPALDPVGVAEIPPTSASELGNGHRAPGQAGSPVEPAEVVGGVPAGAAARGVRERSWGASAAGRSQGEDDPLRRAPAARRVGGHRCGAGSPVRYQQLRQPHPAGARGTTPRPGGVAPT